MSRSLGPALVTPADILEFDLDATPVDPKGRNAVLERFIHGEIFKARPDVMVVVHSHAPSVIPFSITQVPLRPVFHMATFLCVGVPVWDSRSVHDPAAGPCWSATASWASRWRRRSATSRSRCCGDTATWWWDPACRSPCGRRSTRK